jgi:hypothetical protein
MDRLLVASISVVVWMAFSVWAGHEIGASQIQIVAAVWAGIGAIVSGAVFLRRS